MWGITVPCFLLHAYSMFSQCAHNVCMRMWLDPILAAPEKSKQYKQEQK